MDEGEQTGAGIVLGPRTTLYALLAECPYLIDFLVRYHPALRRTGDERARATWARVTTLGDLAVEMNMTWRRLVRDIAAQVARETGRAPVTVDAPGSLRHDDPRLSELREIVEELQRGGALDMLAARLHDLGAGVDGGEAESLEAVLSGPAPAGVGIATPPEPAQAWSGDASLGGRPEGHPLESLERETAQLVVLARALRDELERLGGSPARQRWRAARALVGRLVERLGDAGVHVRRVQTAWLPVLAAAGAPGPASLLHDRHARVLESLRLLRLAVRRDDPRSVYEHGVELFDGLRDLTSCENQVLAPIAERALSAQEWEEVRRREDAVGWALYPAPPPWPHR